ncbi:MAG: NYN domain-containing protein [Candidatus Margulisbacteria bacterium]|nr:NYN domain-containing protein [Candidatus Margulisiibacteriota bacterium]
MLEKLLWVDGFNVIFANKALTELALENIQAAIQKLIEIVAEYAVANECVATIFFDNKKSNLQVQEEEYLGVHIISGNIFQSADNLIEKKSFQLKEQREIVLVTSDNIIKKMIVGRAGCSRLIEAKGFIKKYLEMKKVLSKKTNKAKPVKLVNILQGEVVSYLEKWRHGLA